MKAIRNDAGPRGCFRAAAVLATIVWLLCTAPARAQLDICECTGSPDSLGAFVSSDPETYPPGSTLGQNILTIPLPEDGPLIFDSFTLDNFVAVRFAPNAANDPARVLVAGDVMIGTNATIDVRGFQGPEPGGKVNATGGLPGPGGFRGGDGALPFVTMTTSGGVGLGPGGGAPGTPDLPEGDNVERIGRPGLYVSGGRVAFIGGGGGGGGSTTDLEGQTCLSAGGSGGAGAILIAANGTITVTGRILADGTAGRVIGAQQRVCGDRGGSGAPGAIRLVAETITGGGMLSAILDSAEGEILLEAFTIDLPGTITPEAKRSIAPGPVLPPAAPRVAITSVSGESVSMVNDQPISERPQGGFGSIDVDVNSFDPVVVDVVSENVPEGTGVTVSAKSDTGGVLVEGTEALVNCDGASCTASVSLDLQPGKYFVEAQATFRAAVVD